MGSKLGWIAVKSNNKSSFLLTSWYRRKKKRLMRPKNTSNLLQVTNAQYVQIHPEPRMPMGTTLAVSHEVAPSPMVVKLAAIKPLPEKHFIKWLKVKKTFDKTASINLTQPWNFRRFEVCNPMLHHFWWHILEVLCSSVKLEPWLASLSLFWAQALAWLLEFRQTQALASGSSRKEAEGKQLQLSL